MASLPEYEAHSAALGVLNFFEKPLKMAQTFWLLDADTQQPVCFTTATSSRTVAQVTPQLLRMAAEIFGPQHELMLLADTEHQSAELLDHVAQQEGFEMLVPMANNQALRKQLKTIPAEAFTRGYPSKAAWVGATPVFAAATLAEVMRHFTGQFAYVDDPAT